LKKTAKDESQKFIRRRSGAACLNTRIQLTTALSSKSNQNLALTQLLVSNVHIVVALPHPNTLSTHRHSQSSCGVS
jgi:hypothetical protein